MGYAWRALERNLPEDVKEKATHMRFCKDKMVRRLQLTFCLPVRQAG